MERDGGLRDGRSMPRVTAVIVTHDRPSLLRECLAALAAQTRPPDETLVIDNASPGEATAAAVADHPAARHLRQPINLGGAGGFRRGIEEALARGADLIWLMDDDARPADRECLARLVTAVGRGLGIAAPLVLDVARPERLAFPVRVRGRTRFLAAEVVGRAQVRDFAHLFNGVLVRAAVFRAIGLPDPRFVIRGDEVEWFQRARRGGVAVAIETAVRFLHPSSASEIHPILFGLYYATDPVTETKRHYQFRNRGHIFRAYGLYGYLAADVVRYGWYYLINRRLDLAGLAVWGKATAEGWRGEFLRGAPVGAPFELPANDAGPPPHPARSAGRPAASA